MHKKGGRRRRRRWRRRRRRRRNLAAGMVAVRLVCFPPDAIKEETHHAHVFIEFMGKQPPQRKLPPRLPCIVHALCGSAITGRCARASPRIMFATR